MDSESRSFIPKELQVLDRPIPDAVSRVLIESGERRSLIGTVPLPQVITDHSVIDEHHVEELAHSMATSDRGQISPTTVRARIDDSTNEVVFDVVDGFHRTEALRQNGAETVKVSAMYSCPDEELFDLRILAAQSVQSVQFARVATWMKLAFNSTVWAEKGMDVTRAFGVTLNDTKRPQKVNLNPDEVEGLKEWVRGTSDRWGKGINQTYQILKLVDDSDPSLVEQVRTQGGGKDRKAVVTPTYLKLVVGAFPGVDNYAIQNAVMDVVLKKRMYVPQVNAFLEQVIPYIEEGMSREEVRDAIYRNVDVDSLGVIFEKKKTKPTNEQRRDVSRRHRKSLQEARAEIKDLGLEIGRLKLENSRLSAENDALWRRLEGLSGPTAMTRYPDSGDRLSLATNSNVGSAFSHRNNSVTSERRSGENSKAIDTLVVREDRQVIPDKNLSSKKRTEMVQSPKEIQEEFINKFSDIQFSTIVGGFFLMHKDLIIENGALPIDDRIVDELGDALDQQASETRAPLTSRQVHDSRVDGLALLKKLSSLSSNIIKEVQESVPDEVSDLVKYALELGDSYLLGELSAIALEERQNQYQLLEGGY